MHVTRFLVKFWLLYHHFWSIRSTWCFRPFASDRSLACCICKPTWSSSDSSSSWGCIRCHTLRSHVPSISSWCFGKHTSSPSWSVPFSWSSQTSCLSLPFTLLAKLCLWLFIIPIRCRFSATFNGFSFQVTLNYDIWNFFFFFLIDSLSFETWSFKTIS
jgi:hypothetical protein